MKSIRSLLAGSPLRSSGSTTRHTASTRLPQQRQRGIVEGVRPLRLTTKQTARTAWSLAGAAGAVVGATALASSQASEEGSSAPRPGNGPSNG